MLRVGYTELHAALERVLLTFGFEPERAELCARLFADASRDGVHSHGVRRFPRFAHMVRAGVVDVAARPVRVAGHGALERWDGRRGPGNLNAHDCMDRAIELCRTHGTGCVALGNTNHWMRGGTYGWQAAAAGVIGICWTNTMPNLPPWGGAEPRLGNNPLVVAVPRAAGPVVLDMAMSQFSYGALEAYERRGERLPVVGGADADGRLTDDAAAILASGRPLPIGFWKGSGLAMMLDLVASTLSGGRATHQIEPDPMRETGLSQLFLALDPSAVGAPADADEVADAIVRHLLQDADGGVRYPGQRTLEIRRVSLKAGVEVDEELWTSLVNGEF